MSIVISNIRIGIDEPEQSAIDFAINKIKVSQTQIKKTYIYKKSLDARKKGNITFIASVVVDLYEKEPEIARSISDPFVKYKESNSIDFECGSDKLENPVIIIGFGPSGIFAAHTLAKLGYKPIVFEQGDCVDKRVDAVNKFWQNGILNPKSNVQFGEGGAGTFSDGKLTTRISDNRCDYVLEQFVKHGASEEIMKNAKPHIGTDKLRGIIKSIRQEIIALGGQVHFNRTLTDIVIKNNSVYSVVIDDEEIRTDNIILAIGHSSRETFKMILNKGIMLENKSFSVGVRIEQLQTTIDKGLYGDLAGHKSLPQGEYQLSHKYNGRGVYTFCMCPGGFVIPSGSSENTIVTNGMSKNARDGVNANSALVVSVDENDYGEEPLAGMYFQQQLEQKAFALGGNNYKAPAITVKEFLGNKNSIKISKVIPTYSLGVTGADFNNIFPESIMKMLKLGLYNFDRKLSGFSADDGIITGVETRTSSPIRILRNDNFCSVNIKGLYPCGEGAGYAGGIMSAAVDGIKISQKIASIYKAKD